MIAPGYRAGQCAGGVAAESVRREPLPPQQFLSLLRARSRKLDSTDQFLHGAMFPLEPPLTPAQRGQAAKVCVSPDLRRADPRSRSSTAARLTRATPNRSVQAVPGAGLRLIST